MAEPSKKRDSAKSRRTSQIVQALLVDEITKPKLQEFVQDLEQNRTIEQLEDLLDSWNELRIGLQRETKNENRRNSSRNELEKALESINQHLNSRNSKHRLSVPLADQVLLPGAIAEEHSDGQQRRATEVRPIVDPKPKVKKQKSRADLAKNPSFQRFFNMTSSKNPLLRWKQ